MLRSRTTKLTCPHQSPILLSVMNTTNTTTEYKDADAAWEAGNEWVRATNRWDKLEYLEENCSSDFLENNLLHEVVKFMGEDDFREFFKHLRQNWDIKTPQELDYEMNS